MEDVSGEDKFITKPFKGEKSKKITCKFCTLFVQETLS